MKDSFKLPHVLDVYTCTTFKHTVDNNVHIQVYIYMKIIKTDAL